MMKYLAGVLSVIAIGTLLIAYGLLNPRIATADAFHATQALDSLRVPTAVDGVTVLDNGLRQGGAQAYLASTGVSARPALVAHSTRTDDEVRAASPVRSARVVERAPRRDWKKTAMVIGGSSMAAAGLGGLIGGRKGALIGAVVGGGAGTLYEVTRR